MLRKLNSQKASNDWYAKKNPESSMLPGFPFLVDDTRLELVIKDPKVLIFQGFF